MEILKGQINLFSLMSEKVTSEKIITLEKPKNIYKNSEKNINLEVLEGQIIAFDLIES
ncbi:hypothetical protein QTG88_10675 [Clostridium perfringens]|nr:hypothetical protein [Clostridium perfringens]MDK0685154.1 hypothetical protein [Clostridium perfringens]MDM0450000.1 hypothetical protein [Clostridium perfringens]